MGQSEVLKVLEEKNKGMTTKEVSEILEASSSLVNRALRKLYEQGLVSRRAIRNDVGHPAFEYQIK